MDINPGTRLMWHDPDDDWGPRKTEAVLRLTTDDVTRATGVQIEAGMTIEHHYANGTFEVRVLDTPTGAVLADWTTVS